MHIDDQDGGLTDTTDHSWIQTCIKVGGLVISNKKVEKCHWKIRYDTNWTLFRSKSSEKLAFWSRSVRYSDRSIFRQVYILYLVRVGGIGLDPRAGVTSRPTQDLQVNQDEGADKVDNSNMAPTHSDRRNSDRRNSMLSQ